MQILLYFSCIYKGGGTAAKEWPGNEIPIFKNNQENLRKLDDLVQKLLPEAKAEFHDTTLKTHIRIPVWEKRNIRKGHDYEKVGIQNLLKSTLLQTIYMRAT